MSFINFNSLAKNCFYHVCLAHKVPQRALIYKENKSAKLFVQN